MEFIKSNYINTTTQIQVNSNTNNSAYLFNRDPYYQYYSDGLNSDLTTTVITITFDSTTAVSRIALVDTNFKEFSIFYNGATANAFSLSSEGSTNSSSWTGNIENNLYLRFTTTLCNSITINAKKTITADEEKILGLLIISDLYLDMEQIPDSSGYKPSLDPKQVVHTLSDGGTRIHNVRKKTNLSISLDYVNTELRDDLRDIYDLNTPFNFCPFGTTTSWDAVIFECVWPGSFGFYEFSDNASASGFSGKILLKETPV